MANLFKDHDDLSRLIEISIKVASLDSGCLAYLNNNEILISNQKGEDFVLQNFQLKLKIKEVIKNNKSLFQTFDSVPSTNSFTFICIPLAFSGQSTAKAALCLYSNEFCEIDDKTRLLLEELAQEFA